MNWINIEVSTIDSEEFLGSTPTERGTWLCLMRYCVGQENAGTIPDARNWKDRKWQQIVRVTLKEVQSQSDLWSWEGDDLRVWAYPADKEAEVRTNRENGSRGGRPKKEPKQKPIHNHPVSDGLNPNETTRFEIAETERKGIGKEENRKGMEALSLPSLAESDGPAFAGGGAGELMAWINSIRPEWKKPAHWSHEEMRNLTAGVSCQIQELNQSDRNLVHRFMREDLPHAAGYWQPRSRSKFVQTFPDVFSSAQRWGEKAGIKIDREAGPKGVMR